MRLFWSVGAYNEGEEPKVSFVLCARIPNPLDQYIHCRRLSQAEIVHLTIVNSTDWTTNQCLNFLYISCRSLLLQLGSSSEEEWDDYEVLHGWVQHKPCGSPDLQGHRWFGRQNMRDEWAWLGTHYQDEESLGNIISCQWLVPEMTYCNERPLEPMCAGTIRPHGKGSSKPGKFLPEKTGPQGAHLSLQKEWKMSDVLQKIGGSSYCMKWNGGGRFLMAFYDEGK